jgi:hypothetical protein
VGKYLGIEVAIKVSIPEKHKALDNVGQLRNRIQANPAEQFGKRIIYSPRLVKAFSKSLTLPIVIDDSHNQESDGEK